MSYGVVNPDQRNKGVGGALYRFVRSIPTWVLWLLVVVWSIPSVGLLINSFRTRDDQRTTGWWTVLGDLGNLTLDNYRQVPHDGGGMTQGLTTLRHRPPGDDHPDRLAAFAAYASRIDFKHRQGFP
jgi:alpha-glucoside transport system permease protein